MSTLVSTLATAIEKKIDSAVTEALTKRINSLEIRLEQHTEAMLNTQRADMENILDSFLQSLKQENMQAETDREHQRLHDEGLLKEQHALAQQVQSAVYLNHAPNNGIQTNVSAPPPPPPPAAQMQGSMPSEATHAVMAQPIPGVDQTLLDRLLEQQKLLNQLTPNLGAERRRQTRFTDRPHPYDGQ